MIDPMAISASGLTFNQLRMDVIANNVANANTTRTPEGGPYRREVVVAQPLQQSSFGNLLGQYMGSAGNQIGSGVQAVQIAQDPSPFPEVYDPSSPDAVNGYVQMPNVNIQTEMTDMVDAINAYRANSTAFDASKQLDIAAITLGK